MRYVLIAAPRAELHDYLDTDAQSLELLPDDAFVHVSAEILIGRRTQRSSGRVVKTHTLTTIKGS